MTTPAIGESTEALQQRSQQYKGFNPIQYAWFDNEDSKKWWDQTAPILTRVFEAAKYDVQQQYLYMTLYRTFLIPFLGPHPGDWGSFITYSGIPVEFSINYQDNGPPTCRIGWEPVSHASGTAQDPFNNGTVAEAMTAIGQLKLKGLETGLFDHFVQTLTVNSQDGAGVDVAQLPISRFRNQVAFGLDLKGGGVTIKCYIYPALKGFVTKKPFRELLDHAIQTSDDVMNCANYLKGVSDYLEGAGLYNQYSFIGFDLVDGSKSRLKVYNTIQDVTWAKLEQIWTLGGSFAHDTSIQRGLGFARELWQLLTLHLDKMAVGIWNYELTPGGMVPNPKWYFILTGLNDLENAQAIIKFYQSLGWLELAESFISTFQSYFPDSDFSTTDNLLQYVSLAYSEKTGVYFSVYYHSSR
ncbi:uncharacterized protein N7511_003919 [Penicillium nucicola]|uniref:uncharacterized protein n=1 Tax=Penicillium nucicola TaxID=1850975 RepID=UPI00254527AF|nr:uncharacterized protein N7511_003919 [Penicillium nucicola]KAJ5766303.1 hypothetical protein N7511_003919 [Penicillium nucicola]